MAVMARNVTVLRPEMPAPEPGRALAFDPADQCAPLGNRLLARLSPAAFKQLRSQLQPTWLLGGELVEIGSGNTGALFPVQAIVSVQTVLADGCAVEFAGIGREGYLGTATGAGSLKCARRCLVHAGGLAYRMPTEAMHAAIAKQGEFAALLSDFDTALLGQAAILCGCYRRHSLEQQLARWLLLTLERLPGNEIVVTQEMIANLLGVRREGVTEAAGRLQRAGIIEYRRGHVFVLQRDALEERACECAAAIRAEIGRIYN
jgi:hypothetical protein